MPEEPEFVPPLAAFGRRLLGRRPSPGRRKALDDGSTLDLRCPRCAARLRARCGRTNACPRCRERVTVPGADVARSLMPSAGTEVVVRSSLTEPGERRLPAPVLVLGYEPPWYLVRVRGAETGWAHETGVRLVRPQPPAAR
ncbi:MAG: hypothetical protein QOE45_340 [Frankiaceae bacterium]|jgi:hypothetical protein|nr:hypothetical protein [Frankiaceae bacterium]